MLYVEVYHIKIGLFKNFNQKACKLCKENFVFEDTNIPEFTSTASTYKRS